MRLIRDRPPFWEVVGPLLLYIRSCVDTVLACEFLCDGVLDSDRLDGFLEVR